LTKYPLAWPAGWRRTESSRRTGARFHRVDAEYREGVKHQKKRDMTLAEGISRVHRELAAFGVLEGDAIISTNLPTRLDGAPRGDQREPPDPGVAVYWTRPDDRGATRCMAVDRYDRVRDNLAAIAATLDAMRSIERHGGATILERAFQGFEALPAPGGGSWTWRQCLGLQATAKVTLPEVEQVYRTLRSAAHPDKPGGNAERFGLIQRAWEMAQQELR
jgi:hypothetical protein